MYPCVDLVPIFDRCIVRNQCGIHASISWVCLIIDANFKWICGLVQVEELKKELQKQKELRMIYRKRMERTQDYLRHCLQIAQDNGLLELMTHNKQEQHDQCLLDYNTPDVNAGPQPPTPLHPHSDLTALINQAKINGWYINPNEVSSISSDL